MPKSKKGSNSKQGNSSQQPGNNNGKKKHAAESRMHSKFVFDDGDNGSTVSKATIKSGAGKPNSDVATAPPVIKQKLLTDLVEEIFSNPLIHEKDVSELVGVQKPGVLTTPSSSFGAAKGYGRGVIESSLQTVSPIGLDASGDAFGVITSDMDTKFENAEEKNMVNVARSNGDTDTKSVACSAALKFDICSNERIKNTTENPTVYAVNNVDFNSLMNESTSVGNTHQGVVEETEVLEEEDGILASATTVLEVGENIEPNRNVEPSPADKELATHLPTQVRTTGKSFVSLFNENRKALEKHKLVFTTPPVDDFRFSFDEFESVENTIGFCLVGCVLGRFPGAKAIAEFIKRWPVKAQFQTHVSGWVTFYFQNTLDRDRILTGGPYMVLGRQLFLQLLPRCFLYRQEDMRIVPSWVQIHGLPADMWNNHILGRIASALGKPLNTDRITLDNRKSKFARVLVEIDTQKLLLRELKIILPTNQTTMLHFVYEFEPKFCGSCTQLGHDIDSCPFSENKVDNKSMNTGRKHMKMTNNRGLDNQRDHSLTGQPTPSTPDSSTASGSCSTEFVHVNPDTLLPCVGEDSVVCSINDMVGRRPIIASVQK